VPELEAIGRRALSRKLARTGQGAEQSSSVCIENQVVFGVDGIWLTTRRIDGSSELQAAHPEA